MTETETGTPPAHALTPTAAGGDGALPRRSTPLDDTALDDTAAVSVRGLRKSYGGFAALEGVSFDIRPGETFALLGPNGAGKSTTIEILEGYRDRTGGEARVLGVDPERGGIPWKARLGIVLQSSGESGNVSVREQLAHFASLYPDPRDVDEVIDAVGLTDKASARIRSLSGGQRRRVDVALGVIGRPELLFLDEPTTGFDPEARRHFWDLIRSLKSDGTTILLTTHYLDEAAQLSDRAAVIAGGRLIDMGRIDEIGSAEARTPIVRWTDAAGAHEHRTSEPGMLVSQLMSERGGEPAGLEVIRPSLEDIYLGLVEEHAAGAVDAGVTLPTASREHRSAATGAPRRRGHSSTNGAGSTGATAVSTDENSTGATAVSTEENEGARP